MPWLSLQDEKLIRDKLVSRLKEKEKQKVEHFGERIKNAKETNQVKVIPCRGAPTNKILVKLYDSE